MVTFGTIRSSPSTKINSGHFPNPSPLSEYFFQADHSINDVLLIPLEEGVNGVNQLATKGDKYYWLLTKREKITDYQQEKY